MEYNNNFNGNQNEYMAGAKISIIGVGGGGGNAVNHMIDRKIESVRYIAIKKINMYLIQKYKTIEQEEKIESKILKDIGWSSSEFENEDEGIYIVKYTFSICKLY